MDNFISPKAAELVPELVEQILSCWVDAHEDDPAYQWMRLRSLSHHQKFRLERHFKEFWLPKLIISIYQGPWESVDYTLEAAHGDTAQFRCPAFQPQLGLKDPGSWIRACWGEHSIQEPKALLRLGEGYLNDGFCKGYIINNTDLPGLESTDGWQLISFWWKEAFTALFREEEWMRRYTEKALVKAAAEWTDKKPQRKATPVPNTRLLKFLCLDIQMARRVAVIRHRYSRYDPSGQTQFSFEEVSSGLHLQPPTKFIPESARGGCFCCNRMSGPDLFEVLSQEESMVLCLPGCKALGVEELFDLYAEQFGWRCCVVLGRKTGKKSLQKSRKARFKSNTMTVERMEKYLKEWEGRRWDPLG